MTKLLSPSHNNHAVSLHSEFCRWCEVYGKELDSFNGFRSNRIGRIADLANQLLKLKDIVMEFFDSVIDETTNKLVLAVYTFINNNWYYVLRGLLTYGRNHYFSADGTDWN